MLPKQHRLPASTRLAHPQTFRSVSFTARIIHNKSLPSRFGFVISKSVDKRATARNRIRRLLRSCIEEMLPIVQDGYDILFFPQSTILEIKRDDLYNEVHTFFKEKHVLS